MMNEMIDTFANLEEINMDQEESFIQNEISTLRADRDAAITAREAAEADNAALRSLLERSKRAGYGHEHWDHTMRRGAGCPLCIERRKMNDEIDAALADPHPGDALRAEVERLRSAAEEREKLNALHEQVIADVETIKKMQCEIDRAHVANGVEHERFLLALQDVQNRDFEITQLQADLAAARWALGELRSGCPTAEREAASRYGPNWRDELIDRTLAATGQEKKEVKS